MKGWILKGLKALLGVPTYERYRNYFLPRLSRHKGYNRTYYEYSQSHNSFCYPLFAVSIVQLYQPKVIVELGCGNGGVSLEFQKLGCDVFAFDYSVDAISMAREKGVLKAQRFDVCAEESLPVTGDLAVCMEVAEHIPERHAKHLCRVLSGCSPIVVMSAAPPGQGGHLHLNEQPKSYWIQKMEELGMELAGADLERIRLGWKDRMSKDYDQNLMIFRRERNTDLHQAMEP